jgi:hypothetical protein
MDAVRDYEAGRRLGSIAVEHGVTTRTIMYWVNNIRRKSVRLGYVKAANGEPQAADEAHVPGLSAGTGGKMSDKEVRSATQALEAKIVALQAKNGMPTFPYRTEAYSNDY